MAVDEADLELPDAAMEADGQRAGAAHARQGPGQGAEPPRQLLRRPEHEEAQGIEQEQRELEQREEQQGQEQEQRQQQRIKVIARVRPVLEHEARRGAASGNLSVDTDKGAVHLEQEADDGAVVRKTFQLDAVLGPTTSQEGVFAHMDALIDAVLDGFDATVFAYGQTGSGKTYTMEGLHYREQQPMPGLAPTVAVDLSATQRERLGVVPRTAAELFSRIKSRQAAGTRMEHRVRCSFVQIYNEKILDLLAPAARQQAQQQAQQQQQGLRMRFDSAGERFYVDKLEEPACESAEDLVAQFERGVKAKAMGAHALNAASSRSHCLFTVQVDARDPDDPLAARVSARLSLVDLAGSERVALTGARGKTLREATSINSSLFALRNVISALAQQQQQPSKAVHVPFRDSKLTSLLQHALGGTALALMVACVSPLDAHAEENLSTLAYAARASTIRNRPRRNEDAKTRRINELQAEVRLLRKQLHQAQRLSALALADRTGQGAGDAAAADEPAVGGAGQSVHTKGAAVLRGELLAAIAMVKRMHELELELRQRMELAETQSRAAQAERATLLAENQRLRDHEQILLHLLDSHAVAPPAGMPERPGAKTEEGAGLIARQMLQMRQENEALRDQLATLRATTTSTSTSTSTTTTTAAKTAAKQASRRRRWPGRRQEGNNESDGKHSQSLVHHQQTQLAQPTQQQQPTQQRQPPPDQAEELATSDARAESATPKAAAAKRRKKRRPQVMSVEQLRSLLSGGGGGGKSRRQVAQAPIAATVPPSERQARTPAAPERAGPGAWSPRTLALQAAPGGGAADANASAGAALSLPQVEPGQGLERPLENMSALNELLRTQARLKQARGGVLS